MALRLSHLSRQNGKKSNFLSVPSRNFGAKAPAFKLLVPENLLKTPATQVTKLGNGLTVVTEEGTGDVASVGVLFQNGSASENKHNNGVSHLIEHLLFKGTKKRSQAQLESDLESVGQFTASTSRELSSVSAKTLRGDVPKAVELLGDLLLNSTFGDQALEHEKEHALSESAEASTQDVVLDHLHSIAFQGASLGQSVFGTSSSLKSIKRQDLVEYYRNNYTASQAVLVGTGGVKHAELVKLAQEHLGALPAGSFGDYQAPSHRYTGSLLQVPDAHAPLSHTAIAVRVPGRTDPDYYVLLVLEALIGSWSLNSPNNLKSHLAEIISTEKLAKSFSSFFFPYYNTGLLGVYGKLVASDLADFPFEVLNEFVRISQQASEREVEHAKKRVWTNLLQNSNNLSQTTHEIGSQFLNLGRRESLLEVYSQLQQVDAKAVKRVASAYFYDVDPTVVVIGSDVSQLPDYNQLRNFTSWRTI